MTMQQQDDMFLGSRYLKNSSERFDYESDMNEQYRIEKQFNDALQEIERRHSDEIRKLRNEFREATVAKRTEYYRQKEIERSHEEARRRAEDFEKMRRIARRVTW